MKNFFLKVFSILLKLLGVGLILFGLVMCLASSLQVARFLQILPYAICIGFGVLLLNYKYFFSYLNKSNAESNQNIDALAVGCLLLGFVGLFTFWLLSLIALICGIVFIVMNIRNCNILKGNSIAATGIFFSLISLFLFSVTLIYNPQMHLDQGDAYFYKGKFDEAIMQYTEAIKQEPQFYSVYSQRAKAFVAKGDYNNAIIDYTKNIDSFLAGSSDVYFNRQKGKIVLDRAKVYFLKNEYRNAWEDVRQAESLGATIDTKFMEDLKRASQ